MTRSAIAVTLLGANVIVREGLRRILTEEHFDVIQSIDSVEKLLPHDGESVHLVVIDQGPGPTTAAASIGVLKDMSPAARIVVLCDSFDFSNMLTAFAVGAHGYIIKEMSCDPLIGSLRLVAMGEKVMPSHLVDLLPHVTEQSLPGDIRLADAKLSEREDAILHCLILGLPNKMISRRLAISEATVKVHVKAILRKLHVQNRTQAAIRAVGGSLRLSIDAANAHAPFVAAARAGARANV